MTTQPDDGGPVYPTNEANYQQDYSGTGISLRDHCAIEVIKGLMANPNVVGHNPACGWALVNCTMDDIAEFAHKQADAMLAARGKK